MILDDRKDYGGLPLDRMFSIVTKWPGPEGGFRYQDSHGHDIVFTQAESEQLYSFLTKYIV